MKILSLKIKKSFCKFCGTQIKDSSARFCNNKECFQKRLEASGAIDLRNNSQIIDLGNGYIQIKPIDTTKKYKAGT